MTANVDNLMNLASMADLTGNHEEAYKYYTQVLEIDSSNALAWHGRGKAAGSLSTGDSFRLHEMRVAFDEAMRLSPSEQLLAMRQLCAKDAGAIARKCFRLTRLTMGAYEDSIQARHDADWPAHVRRCRELIETYEYCLALAPQDVRYMKGIVEVCRNNVQGYICMGSSSNYDLRMDKPEMLARAEHYTNLIRQMEPDYHPKMALPSAGGCFVVTATMGDERHPTVTTLRSFRDEDLSRSATGRRFIVWYRLNGPKLAQFISRSQVRRMVAYVLIVAPAAAVVRCLNLARRQY